MTKYSHQGHLRRRRAAAVAKRLQDTGWASLGKSREAREKREECSEH